MICQSVSFINTTLHRMLNVIKNTYPGSNYERHIVIIAACWIVFNFRSTCGVFFAMSLVYFMCMALLKMITCNSCHEYLLVRIHKCGTSRFRFMPSVLIISLENFVLFVCMFVSFAGNHISYKSTTFT